MDLKRTLAALSAAKFAEFTEEALVTLILNLTKEELCRALGKSGFSSFFQTTQSPRLRLRKLAAKLICEIANEDEKAQRFLCDTFGFTPLQGKVCINKMPPKVKEQLTKNPKLLISLREVPEKKKKYWCFPPVNATASQKAVSGYTMAEELVKDFPDPAEHWIGFVCTVSHTKHRQNYSVIGGVEKESSERVPNSFFESATNKPTSKGKNPVQSFINKLPISPVRAGGTAKARVSVPAPVTVQVVKKEEEDKLTSQLFTRNYRQMDSPQSPSFNDLIIEEQEDSMDESPQLISAGSGSESASKFRFSLAARQSPLLIENDFPKQEVEEGPGNKPSKVVPSKPKTAAAKNPAKVTDLGKTQPVPRTSYAQPPSKPSHNKKGSYSYKPKTAREHFKKDSLKTTLDKHFALKTVVEVNEKKRRTKNLNQTNEASSKVNTHKRNHKIEVLSFIATTRRSIGQTINEKNKKSLIAKKPPNTARVPSVEAAFEKVLYETADSHKQSTKKGKVECRFSLMDFNTTHPLNKKFNPKCT